MKRKSVGLALAAILAASMGMSAMAADSYLVGFANNSDTYNYCAKFRTYLKEATEAEGIDIMVSIAAEIVQEKNRYDVSYIDGAVEDAVRKKENGIMITIISKSGSSPRGTGSKMFIDKDGNSYGSIGGGNVEFQALKYAPEAQHGEIRKYNLSNQGGANLGMICGGEVEVLYELL